MKKVVSKIMLSTLLLSSFSTAAYADNPIIKDKFTGDPAALVQGDKVYLYAGHDEASAFGNFYFMPEWVIYSSTDMENWKQEGSLSVKDTFSWAREDAAWASQVIERDGTFYWYVATNNKDGSGYCIGVATSQSPTEGFTDALGKPLITNQMTTSNISWDDIDPTVLVDDDGQGYLYWGNSYPYYAKLKPNMIELDGDIQKVTINNLKGGFTEAPWIHKRNGKYYLSFAHNWPEGLAYAMSESPTGPWEYKGMLMDPFTSDPNDKNNSNTSHQSIIDFKGKSYIIYHTAALPTGSSYRRSVSIDRLYYNPDGTIKKVVPTSTGLDGEGQKLQSYSFLDRYIRHYNNDARIDPLDVLNISNFDARWQIVPGLANSGEEFVSIQSVNKPGYYLRHSNNDLALVKNDGTDLFKADTTFKKVPGLSDPNWASFQSYNFPNLYIKQKDYLLKLEQVNTEGDKENATFKMSEADVKDVQLNIDSLTLQQNDESNLSAIVLPNSVLNQKVTFSSSDPNVVSISKPTYNPEDGKTTVTITAKSPGNADIIATTDEGQFTDSATISVEKQKPATIKDLKISVNDRKVVIEGSLNQKKGTDVAVRVTAPNGKLDYLDQITTEDDGKFSYVFTLSNHAAGKYDVSLGATDLSEIVNTSFQYKLGPQNH
ncbi:family 43 glycosylhydrolase [Neobacillus drentensis]|uniref:family 43 glycosylhydrolase n=1 Tax=Neobacillus drentensis TaxID=220684 RepID=UPI002FFD95A3